MVVSGTAMAAMAALAVLAAGLAGAPALAQQIGGGVNVPGEWWLGEGLKQGDMFSYRLCHVDYKECDTFELQFWISGDRQVGSESRWVAKSVVYDGSRVYKGDFELGKVSAEPSGGPKSMANYRDAMKSSISWLSAFATSYGGEKGKGPKAFSAPSWGKIANIGGEQVRPLAAEKVTVLAGTFDTVRVGWKTGGAHSNVWVVDEFPFPVKASTWTHVSEGIPPQEYAFSLLSYEENVTSDPFADIVPYTDVLDKKGCPDNSRLDFTFTKEVTRNFGYLLEVGYKPEQPKAGCDMDWIIKFKKVEDETEFLNQVQYDMSIGPGSILSRNIAAEENKRFLYSPSGLAQLTTNVKEPPGTYNYTIWVFGLAPEFMVPQTPTDTLTIEVTVLPSDGEEDPTESVIPGWIKNSAGFWADDQIDDDTFVNGLEWLIQKRIIIVPYETTGGSGGMSIPSWVKNNAGLWARDQINDDTFVMGLQWLIEKGIIRV